MGPAQERSAAGGPKGSGTGRAAVGAAAVMLALALWGRGLALVLAGALVGPVPALRTALALAGDRQVPASSAAAESGPAPAASSQTDGAPGIQSYLVELQPDSAMPADAQGVVETAYGQGSGEKYIACAAGTIKNNTSVPSAEVAAEIQNPLPFQIQLNSPEPQVLIMHTHATECYRMSQGLWADPAGGARTTDRASNMCAVGRVMADTLNAAGIHTLHDETLNDYPSYNGSYANSRAVVQQYLAQYPSIKVVVDVHRDAIENAEGARMAPVAEIQGQKSRPGDADLRVRQRLHRVFAQLEAEPAVCRRLGERHGGDVPRADPAGAVQLPVLQPGPDHRQPAAGSRHPRQQPERGFVRRAAGRQRPGRRPDRDRLTNGRRYDIVPLSEKRRSGKVPRPTTAQRAGGAASLPAGREKEHPGAAT